MRLLLVSRWVLHKLAARDGYKPMNDSAAASAPRRQRGRVARRLGGQTHNPVRRTVDCTNTGPLEDSAPQPSPSAPHNCRLADHAVTPLPSRCA